MVRGVGARDAAGVGGEGGGPSARGGRAGRARGARGGTRVRSFAAPARGAHAERGSRVAGWTGADARGVHA